MSHRQKFLSCTREKAEISTTNIVKSNNNEKMKPKQCALQHNATSQILRDLPACVCVALCTVFCAYTCIVSPSVGLRDGTRAGKEVWMF